MKKMAFASLRTPLDKLVKHNLFIYTKRERGAQLCDELIARTQRV